MVFEEISYRQPTKMRRPDRDRRWACLAYELPDADDLPIYLNHVAADAIERHALRDTSVELGGILLGKECVDDQTGVPFVWITGWLEAKHYENTQASFTYTHDSWEEITRERDRSHPDLDIVGWYHTHPDFGVFLSGHDLFIHNNFFAQKLQVAYVVDPIRQTRGFFQWRNGSMSQVSGFYLSAERADRVALARLANDLENFPDSSPQGTGIGGGLSPRLEAELIAMLTRPTMHHQAQAVDRTQSAMVFALLGLVVGVLGLSSVLWLNTIFGQIQDQGKTIDEIKRSVTEANDRHRITFETALGEPGGLEPDRFLKKFNTLANDRDEARKQLSRQASVNELLTDKANLLGESLVKLGKKYEAAQTFEKDAEEYNKMRPKYAELQATSERLSQKIGELEDLLDSTAGKGAIDLTKKYQKAWYLAVSGWVVSALLLGALIVGYTYLKFPPEDDSGTINQSIPPHRIT